MLASRSRCGRIEIDSGERMEEACCMKEGARGDEGEPERKDGLSACVEGEDGEDGRQSKREDGGKEEAADGAGEEVDRGLGMSISSFMCASKQHAMRKEKEKQRLERKHNVPGIPSQ
jgi:hypothetical protein